MFMLNLRSQTTKTILNLTKINMINEILEIKMA